MSAIVPLQQPTNVEAYRASTDAAGICRDIVIKTAKNIQGRKYVCVEGWQAIAIAHGCTASADHVERVNDEGMSGFKATGIVRRMSDGAEIARAEGFLGDDEKMWASRPVYARRAMVQTRAISRACRSAFAHVVVMIDAGLSTTPFEEVPQDGFDDRQPGVTIEHEPRQEPAPRAKLEGKYPSAAQLKKALHEFVGKLQKAETLAAVEALKAEYADAITQCQRALPMWWAGDGTPDKRGICGQIEDRLEAVGGDNMCGELIRSMKEHCETPTQLAAWVKANEALIDALEDADARRFQMALDLFESALIEVARANAG